ncbi:twin-arginine translocase subunit TatC [Aureibaculum sp. A20]|uniref:Sec-independent protein translocase protein TatC n=1 Tax=Aureibaculum flavum TaxID=2795986 RepID=A0ABS0WRP9_9FLAO|nr:twin-arginine translocase subunit TatC [Aureibaculum flavum]MBJ2174643.1 twin-arginine translocase subunit TatC [Aureibaculum flavum]
MAKKKTKEEKEMSFLDHLEVLRWTLVRSTLAVLVMSSIAFLMKSFIFDVIIFLPKDPQFITYRFLCNLSEKLGTNGLCIEEIPFIVQSRTMAGQFSAHIWTSITVGFIAAFPFILWEIWKFIKPALYVKERKHARSFIIISSLLFFLGVLFGYFLITPLSINFLGSYRVSMQVENNTDISSYIGLLRASVLAAGLIFEMPVIIYFLAKMGIVTPEFLRKYRKYAIVVLLLLAAIITPPDVVSQFIVAIPMAILYEVSIIIASVMARKARKRAAKV